MTVCVVFLGTAGCGKSSLTAAYGSWLERNLEAEVCYVNLDQGADYIPYKPDYDVRSLITVEELMRKERLGPNGALVKAAELMAKHADEIASKIAQLQGEFILVDTPGQMEIFVFRSAGPTIVEKLKQYFRVVGVFIVDPELYEHPANLIVSQLLAVTVQLRLNAPCIFIAGKADLKAGKKIKESLKDMQLLKRAILEKAEGAIVDLALMAGDIVERLLQASRVVSVSALTGEGMEDLHDLLHEAFCVCGDLT